MTNDIHYLKHNSLDVWCFETKPDILTTTSIRNVTCIECLEVLQAHLYQEKKYFETMESHKTHLEDMLEKESNNIRH